ncbi:hypothetical protein H0I25_09600 [Cellulophaga sp. HaHa_2_95]|uniref:hypothetical protein n=1 Tax=Cellulophaga sp. HaHa_2_95 TaxID=2745558 RepID=UPI001C4F881A|nr:hypothetical protein [Cellulophaga sp. HaHa_2_95]QXP58006.1 hypothetical protein H0I25_09600 [Cellulophaga sp. HaHa_2_95]
MGNKLSKVLLSCIAISLLAALGIPDIAKIAHAVLEHNEQTCQEKTKGHIHETEFDCEFHKYHITTYFTPEIYSFQVLEPVNHIFFNEKFYFLLSEFQQLHFTLRGPPLHSYSVLKR